MYQPFECFASTYKFRVLIIHENLCLPKIVVLSKAGGEIITIPTFADEDFSLSSGLKYGLTLGYTFKNNLGVELGVDYFNRHKEFTIEKTSRLTKDWSYKATTFRPVVTFTVDNKEILFYGQSRSCLI
jgi:hypothetical protein